MGEAEFEKKTNDKESVEELADNAEDDDDDKDEEEESTEASQDSDGSSNNEKQEQSSERRELLCSGSGAFVKHWNNFIIVLAMYNSVLIPMQIFYTSDLPSSLKGQTIDVIDACVDLCFLIDIIITFRTTFLDPMQSIEVKDPHVIGLKYIKGQFFIDFISSVPFTSLFRSTGGAAEGLLDALGLLKLLRL